MDAVAEIWAELTQTTFQRVRNRRLSSLFQHLPLRLPRPRPISNILTKCPTTMDDADDTEDPHVEVGAIPIKKVLTHMDNLAHPAIKFKCLICCIEDISPLDI